MLEKSTVFVGVLSSSSFSYGCGDLRIVKDLQRQFILLLCIRNGCVLLDSFSDFPSATNNAKPTQRGAAAAAHHRHGLKVEDEGLLNDLVVIFVFLGVLCTAVSFNASVLFAKYYNSRYKNCQLGSLNN
jgi:hypothetical protein